MFISKTTSSLLAFVCGVFVATEAAQADTWYVDDDANSRGTLR